MFLLYEGYNQVVLSRMQKKKKIKYILVLINLGYYMPASDQSLYLYAC